MDELTPFSKMQIWFTKFERCRPPHKAGLPLWALKITDTELDEITALLTQLFIAKEPLIIFKKFSCTGGICKFDQIFTLFLATWIQRNFCGGRERWSVVLENIRIKHENRLNSAIYDSVRSGLNYWGIKLHATATANQYFATLYCQGGFPRSGLIGLVDGPVSNYLDSVITHYGLFYHTSTLEQIAYNELQLLPETLKQLAFAQLASQLISRLIELRDRYHLYSESEPVTALNAKNPLWREKLPFLLCDEEAHELIGRLLNKTASIVRREQNPIRIRRYLIFSLGVWSIVGETYINQTIHPDDLGDVLEIKKLPVYFDLYTQIESGSRIKTASFNLKGQQNKRWQVITKQTRFYNEDAISAMRYDIWSDGVCLGNDLYYRGEALNDELPWIFSAEDENYRFIGQGSVNALQNSVYVLSIDELVPKNNISTVEKIANLEGVNRWLYKIKGTAVVNTELGNIFISTGAEESQEFSCWLSGDKCTDVISIKNSYIGRPKVLIKSGFRETKEISPEQLFWRGVDDLFDTPLNSSNLKYGLGSIFWKKNDEVKWKSKCAILPDDSKLDVVHYENGEVELKTIGLQNSDLGMISSEKNWLRGVDKLEDMFLAEIQLPSTMPDNFHPIISWNHSLSNTITFEFDSMQSGICLLDHNGKIFTGRISNLTLDDLYSYKLKIKLPHNESQSYLNVSAALFNKKRIRATASEHINLESKNTIINAGVLAKLAQALYSQSDDLYDFITFKFYSPSGELESKVSKVSLFKHSVSNLNNELLKVHQSRQHKDRNSIILKAAPIWDLSREHVVLQKTTNKYQDSLFNFPKTNEVGPWFIYAVSDRSIQPRAVFIGNETLEKSNVGLTGLQIAVRDLQFNKETACFDYLSMDQEIEALMTDAKHENWITVQSFVDILDLARPATFHIFKRLIYKPKIMAALLLKQEQQESFERVWSISSDMPFEWLNININDWCEAARLIVNDRVLSVEPLKEQISSDQYYDISKSIMQNCMQLLSDKGEYFKILSDTVLFNCFDMTPQWLNVEIYNEEGENRNTS